MIRVTVKVVGWDKFSRHETDWARIRRLQDTRSLFSEWPWLEQWWNSFSNSTDSEFVGLLLYNDQRQLVGMIPFVLHVTYLRTFIRVRRLQLLGDYHGGPHTMRTEYQRLNVDPNFRVASVTAAWQAVNSLDSWDDLVIKDIDAGCLATQLFCDLAATASHFRPLGDEKLDRTWRITTTGEFAKFSKSLSQSTRRSMFNKRRALELTNDVRLEWAKIHNVEGYIESLDRLHQIRWGKNLFRGDQRAFICGVCNLFAKENRLRLSALRVNGATASILLNVLDGKVEYNLQLGINDSMFGSRFSLGHIHLGYAIERAFRCSDTDYLDLLAGKGKATDYKSRFSLHFGSLRSVQFVRRGPTRLVHRLRDTARRSTHKKRKLPLAVVTAAHSVTGYNTAVALSRFGLRVIGLADESVGSEFARSRFWFRYVRLERHGDSLGPAISELSKEFTKTGIVLFPCDDDSVVYISERWHTFGRNVTLSAPSRKDLRKLMSKNEFYNWAGEAGVRHPISADVLPGALRNAVQSFSCSCPRFIVKPSVRSTRWNDRFPTEKFLSSETDGFDQVNWEEIERLADRFVVQEWIPGDDRDIYFCLCIFDQKGNCRAAIGGRKLFQWPESGGNTAICVTWNDPELIDLGRSSLRDAGLVGIGSIEFKKSTYDGHYYAIEPTVGRSDHQSKLALASGLNIPYIAFLDSIGSPAGWHHPTYSARWVDELAAARLCRKHGLAHFMSRLRQVRVSRTSFARISFSDPGVTFGVFCFAITKLVAFGRKRVVKAG